MTQSPQDTQGLPARRAALRLLDAVLRRGETLDQAATAATKGLLLGYGAVAEEEIAPSFARLAQVVRGGSCAPCTNQG